MPDRQPETCARSESLERLVKDEDDEADNELVGDGEREADENGVEDETKLEVQK